MPSEAFVLGHVRRTFSFTAQIFNYFWRLVLIYSLVVNQISLNYFWRLVLIYSCVGKPISLNYFCGHCLLAAILKLATTRECLKVFFCRLSLCKIEGSLLVSHWLFDETSPCIFNVETFSEITMPVKSAKRLVCRPKISRFKWLSSFSPEFICKSWWSANTF